jgi:hypothetical protein
MEMHNLVPLDDGGTTPLDPKDVAAIVVVRKVLDWMAETGDYTYTHAFEATGVSYWSFYRAYRRPAVQAMVADWLDELNLATASMLRKRSLGVMHNMMEIASGNKGDERAAVQAARFLESVRHRVEESHGDRDKVNGEVHPAKLLVESYLKPKALRRTTVVEEVEIADESSEHRGGVAVSDGNW